MSITSASRGTCACSHQWVLPYLGPQAIQRLRLSLAR
jgi:hypothetical protein